MGGAVRPNGANCSGSASCDDGSFDPCQRPCIRETMHSALNL